MTSKDREQKKQNHEKRQKRLYQKPEIKSEPVTSAFLTQSCNGHGQGGRKASIPCSTLLS